MKPTSKIVDFILSHSLKNMTTPQKHSLSLFFLRSSSKYLLHLLCHLDEADIIVLQILNGKKFIFFISVWEHHHYASFESFVIFGFASHKEIINFAMLLKEL